MTPRWYPLRPHAKQQALYTTNKRFVVVPSGRRSGKTEVSKRKIIRDALYGNNQYLDPRYFFAAPTRDQAKRIYWTDVKNMIPKKFIHRCLEMEQTIYLINGAEIHLIGMDKPERIEGTPWNGGVLDEYGNMKEKTWYEHVRPALSDRIGFCWFIGVPEGRNHYYDLYQYAMQEENEQWGVYHWKSEEILDPAEIASAKHDLDELTYKQEYEGDFIYFQGKAYYNFNQAYHCCRLAYNPKNPLIFCYDFNVAPGVAIVCQEFPMTDDDGNILDNDSITGVIGEVYVPRNSNSEIVTNKLLQQWGHHEGLVFVYGDASGGHKGSAKLMGSDWEIISKMLMKHYGMNRVFMRVPRQNPMERSRVNAVNSRMKSVDGIVRLVINPLRAPMLVRDFEGVRLIEGGSGEIDKKSDPKLTHPSDAISYYIWREFPVRLGLNSMIRVETKP